LSNKFDDGYVVGLSLGGKTDWGLRGELEFAYRDNEGDSAWNADVAGVGTIFVNPPGPTGYVLAFTTPVTGTVTSVGDITVQAYSVMANVWYDFDVDSVIKPYIGGGVGVAYVEANIDMTGGNLTLNGPAPWSGLFTVDTSIDGDDGGSFAFQVGAGVSVDLDAVELFAEYRYFEAVGVELDFTQSFGQIDSFDYVSQSVLGGIRIPFGAEEPVVATPEAPPAADVAKTYIVFFDFNKSNLTAEAQGVVAEAADAYKATGSVRVQVVGHTDTVGSASYNQQLSERRAAAVAAEMVRLGVPADAITTEGRGFSDPMVPTGPGVREPQNRRAVIELS
jgi:outer membrane protein OmpA-like peptidoglycan-associated protein